MLVSLTIHLTRRSRLYRHLSYRSTRVLAAKSLILSLHFTHKPRYSKRSSKLWVLRHQSLSRVSTKYHRATSQQSLSNNNSLPTRSSDRLGVRWSRRSVSSFQLHLTAKLQSQSMEKKGFSNLSKNLKLNKQKTTILTSSTAQLQQRNTNRCRTSCNR